MTPKEEALINTLRIFFKKSFDENFQSLRPYCEQYVKKNRYSMDLMTLLDDESKSSKE